MAIRVNHVANCAWPLELAQVRERVDVRLLHHVLASRSSRVIARAGAIEPLVVAAHDELEESRVSVQNLLHDLFIALLRDSSRTSGLPCGRFII
jgi:hypothetical protein